MCQPPLSSILEKASIALQLEECIITVPVTQCPDISPVDKETLLSHFIFLPDSEEEAIRVVLCSSGGNLEDLSGNQINNFRYSPHIGYYKKERGIGGHALLYGFRGRAASGGPREKMRKGHGFCLPCRVNRAKSQRRQSEKPH